MSAKKTTFWPMVGGIASGFANYLAILRYVDHGRPTRDALTRWIVKEYELKDSYARNIVALLLVGTKLVAPDGKSYSVSPIGAELIKSGSPLILYEVVAREFIGIDELVSIIEERQSVSGRELLEGWEAAVRKASDVRWNSNHARMQFRHRIELLRSLGIVEKVSDSYYLTKAGLKISTRRRVDSLVDEEAIAAATHNDIENKLRTIGEFFEFTSIKRAPVNDARPPNTPRLSENRQLDCLWARVIHFGGKVQYAFEVQMGGNISDAIERLEMVALFVQKAIVITDESQEAKIRDRLSVKHSPLRDKILFLSYDDIDNVVEAVNALKVFAAKVFHD